MSKSEYSMLTYHLSVEREDEIFMRKWEHQTNGVSRILQRPSGLDMRSRLQESCYGKEWNEC